jgi:hypothetical protein
MSLLSQSLSGLSAEQKKYARQLDCKAPVLPPFVSLKLSSEPILTVDLATSGSNEADESGFHSILAINGRAGGGANGTSDAPKGTGAIVKTTFHPEGARTSLCCQIETSLSDL